MAYPLTSVRGVWGWLAACAALMFACVSAQGAWGLKYEVRANAADPWSQSVSVPPGATVFFRFGVYFDPGLSITVADGTGACAAMNRFTGSNMWQNWAAGDAIGSLIRTISSGNPALLSVSGNTIGTTAITSFGSQLFLSSLPDPPEIYKEVYTGRIDLDDANLSVRTLTLMNKTYGSGNTQGLTFYTYASPANRQSGPPNGDNPLRFDLVATIEVNNPCPFPVVTPLASQSVCDGTQVVFTAIATHGPHTYQWRKNLQPLAGETGQTLTLNAVTQVDNGSYDVIVTNSCGSTTSAAATLNVYTPPTILAQPVSAIIRPGTNAALSVVAAGNGPLQYQWFKGVTQLTDAGRISGSQTPILQISDAQLIDGGTYSCFVTDNSIPVCKTTTTNQATLSIGDCLIEWNQVASTGPGARRNPVMAFDSDRGRLVLFGGSDELGALGDTWEWDGNTWALKSITGPGPRTGHAMAYDVARGRTVLFGGYNAANQAQNDTWTWNGSAWTKVAMAGPTARFYSTMAFDSVRDEIILFGGLEQDFDLPEDTWAWDGTAWALAASTGPDGRYASSMAFEAVRQRVVLFGGFDVASENFDDTWEWDGTAWTFKHSGAPTARTGASMAFDPGRGRIIIFGGRILVEDQIVWSTRTWEWDGTSWLSTLTGVPSARWLSSMALDTTRQRIVLFGGEDSTGALTGDTWELASRVPITEQPTSVAANFGQNAAFHVVATGPSLTYRWRRNGVPMNDDVRISGTTTANLLITQVGLQDEAAYDVVISSPCGTETSEQALLSVASCPSSWQEQAVGGPPARWDGASAADIFRKQIVLFGGRSGPTSTSWMGDTWVWNGTSWSQKVVAGPSPRSDHAMASLASGAILFGGRDAVGSNYLNDTWVWNGTAWTLANPAHKPSPRLGTTLAYDSTRDRVVLFGGVGSGDVLLGDTWEFDGVDWTQVAASGPVARFGHHMAFDSARGRTVMFGGALFLGTVFFDTWEWDGGAWVKKAEGGPSAQIYGGMAYDPLRLRCVFVSGYTHNRVFSSETWEWNGTNWAKSLNVGPQVRQNTSIAYDHQRSRVVLFGGFTPSNVVLGDTWSLVLGPSVVTPPQNQTVGATHTAIFSVSGSAPGLLYRWLRNGVNMNDGGRISGVHTPTLTIAMATAADAASYRVRVTDACGSNVISSAATLTVTCTADLNGDNVVDDLDFQVFIVAYDTLLCDPAPAPCAADLNADGFVDDADFSIFIVQYETLLCP